MLLSGKVPGEAKMPRQMEGAPGKQGWGEGDLHTAMQILAPDSVCAPHQYPASHLFMKTLCKDPCGFCHQGPLPTKLSLPLYDLELSFH